VTENPPESGFEWIDTVTDAGDSMRSYMPVEGPEEPPTPPPGRGSASVSDRDVSSGDGAAGTPESDGEGQ
jgi:hypothetical protein